MPLVRIDLSKNASKERIRAVSDAVYIAIARNMTTTAEGVETQQQLDLLRTLGCDQMQGYFFSAARPPEELEKLF